VTTVSNALDLFRAQQAAVEQVHNRLNEVAGLLARVNDQVTRLAQDKDFRQLSQEERTWLESAHRLVNETRRWCEGEAQRYWPALMSRWVATLVFALASAYAVGLGYARVARPFAVELEALRPRAELGLLVEHRMSTMTPAERRQFDALMRWKRGAR
jgi:hypothetical protein